MSRYRLIVRAAKWAAFCPSAGLALALGACASSSDVTSTQTTVGGAEVSTTARSGSVSIPGASIGGGVGVVSIEPAPPPGPEQPYIGPWTLARAGDRVCSVDLGSRNASGRLTAKTRNCGSVELARIAHWNPTPKGLVLYDFEEKEVANLVERGPAYFEGTLAGGGTVTLWR